MLDAQTLTHGLNDSPAGMLAWILQRWRKWSDKNGDFEDVFDRDFILTNATIYWVTESIGSSIRACRHLTRPWKLSKPHPGDRGTRRVHVSGRRPLPARRHCRHPCRLLRERLHRPVAQPDLRQGPCTRRALRALGEPRSCRSIAVMLILVRRCAGRTAGGQPAPRHPGRGTRHDVARGPSRPVERPEHGLGRPRRSPRSPRLWCSARASSESSAGPLRRCCRSYRRRRRSRSRRRPAPEAAPELRQQGDAAGRPRAHRRRPVLVRPASQRAAATL